MLFCASQNDCADLLFLLSCLVRSFVSGAFVCFLLFGCVWSVVCNNSVCFWGCVWGLVGVLVGVWLCFGLVASTTMFGVILPWTGWVVSLC